MKDQIIYGVKLLVRKGKRLFFTKENLFKYIFYLNSNSYDKFI
jgi:hypothetical protein